MIDRKPIYLKWLDARGVHDRWVKIEDLEDGPVECCIIESIGFVIREDHVGIHLAPHVGFDGDDTQFCGDMQIPRSCIIERKDLDI